MSETAEVPVTPPPQQRPVFRRWRRWLPRAVFEVVLIVLSVVLALAVSDWAANRRTAQRVEEMRGYLIQEMKANRALLVSDYYMPHHERLKRVFGEATGVPGSTNQRDAETAIQTLLRTGVHQPSLQDAVWSSISGSELIEHMKPEEMFILARVYRAQGNTEVVNMNGYENAMGLMGVLSGEERPSQHMVRMTIYFEDLIAHERNLIELYDEALKTLGEAPQARDAALAKG